MTNDKLEKYHALLIEWQKTINLVAPSTVDDAWNRHFEDSIQLLDYIPKTTKTICDIGSGAGFPGLVLAIMRPDIQFHLIESDARKCAFLRNVSRETLCDNVTIHNDRIENVIGDISCDVVTSRALASLRMLICYTAPLWDNNIDFKLIIPKGQNYEAEIKDAEVKYTFDYADYPSKTDAAARILSVGNIIEK
jgi:16S rRNA (guanine527-N7)-methyltransferase